MPRILVALLVCCALLAVAEDQVPRREETIVVTGAFEPVPLQEADRAITALDTREAPLLYSTWIDYFRLEPSLDLRQRAPGGVQADLSIRGSSFGQALVLLNGMRVNDAQTGHHNLDVPLPMAAIDRLEILRGAGSTLYGSDALGGAVNFITSPPQSSEFRLGVAAGNFGVNQQHGSAAYILKRWSQQLSFARDFSSGFRPNRDYRSLALASDTNVSSRLGRSTVLLAYSDRPFGADQFYGNFNSWERTKTWFTSLGQDLGKKTRVAFAYRRHTDLFVLYRDRPQVYANRHATENWQAALRRQDPVSKNATFFYGVEGYRDSIRSNNLGRHARHRGAAYADFDVRALRRFSFALGAREEVFQGGRHEFSPSASAGVWLTSRLKLRAGVSRAFRLPTYTDLYYRDPASMGDPNLRPESAWSYEGGLDWHATDGAAAAVTIFHRREKDGIDYVRRTAAEIWRATNIQNLRFTGVEASLRLRLAGSQQLLFAYTGLHGAQHALGGMLSRYVFNYATHNGSVQWQGTVRKIVARTRVTVTERRARDPYALWDAALTRSFGRFTPYAQISNLSNSNYQEITGVPMPGRSAVVGVEFAISKAK
jgi:iron complex outermembrane receptor protein